jgi:hypothetical protein
MLDCTYKTNRFDMPLLNCIRLDNRNTAFTVFVGFIDAETKSNYNFHIQALSELFGEGLYPTVISTDCEVALMNSLERFFSPIRTKHVLCIWHVFTNVTTHCKSRFETAER